MSVTALYGASSAAVPRGAWIVTHRCSEAATGRPAHQSAGPREVAMQYANWSSAGGKPAHHASSAPFHSASALADGSSSRAVITSRIRVSLSDSGSASLRVARLTHV